MPILYEKSKNISETECYLKYRQIKKNTGRKITRRVWDKENKNISRRQIIRIFGSWAKFKNLMEKMENNPDSVSLKDKPPKYKNTHRKD